MKMENERIVSSSILVLKVRYGNLIHYVYHSALHRVQLIEQRTILEVKSFCTYISAGVCRKVVLGPVRFVRRGPEAALRSESSQSASVCNKLVTCNC